MKMLVPLICLTLLPWISCHGHSHDHEEAPAFKWSKAANTPSDEDLTLDEEGVDLDNIETITGHGHAHVVTEKPRHGHEGHGHGHGGHGHAHGGHGHTHGGHGHSHGGHGQREPTEEEREKFRKKLHANWDDDEDDHEANNSTIWFNAMMSTLLISAAPFFILFFIPLDRSEEKQWLLKILLAFASGGLLGDAFLHLIPHAMMAGESEDDGHHGHQHGHSHGGEEGGHAHDMSVGLGVLSGILAFLCVEKVVRIMKGGHSHSHSHTVKPPDKKEKKPADEKKKSKDNDGDDKSKESKNESKDEKVTDKADETLEAESSDDEIKVAGFLNLAADMFHNFTDGLAVGASYLAGDSIGLITTITILFHEIPHEIGDFAILIQSGVPRGKAIALQALTAIGAVTGCALSLLLGGATEAAASLTLPFTAGGFIYIATVSVIPELLEGSSLKQTVMEVAAMLLGVGMMVVIAQYE